MGVGDEGNPGCHSGLCASCHTGSKLFDVFPTVCPSTLVFPPFGQPEVVLPWEGDLLDWEKFAVVLRYEDIPNLEKILKGIPEKVLEEKRTWMQRTWTRFVWASPSVNPFKDLPKEVGEKWGPELVKNDVLGTLIEVLKGRLATKYVTSSWLGGAEVDKIDKIRYSGKIGYEPLILRSLEGKVNESGGTAQEERGSSEEKEEKKERRSKCPNGCSNRGSCNEELGECNCLTNYGGPNCSEVALPGCQLSANNFSPCYFRSTCSCLAQCNKLLFTTTFTCYNEQMLNGSVDSNLDRLFDGPEAVISLDGEGREVGERNNLPEKEWKKEWLAPHHCPHNCSGRGMCHRESKVCQ